MVFDCCKGGKQLLDYLIHHSLAVINSLYTNKMLFSSSSDHQFRVVVLCVEETWLYDASWRFLDLSRRFIRIHTLTFPT